MSDVAQVKSNTRWYRVLAPLITTLLLTGSLSGCLSSGGGSDAGTAGAPVVAPVAPVVVPNPISAFANAGGGNVTVTSANTLTPGAIIVISGTTSYNGTFTVISATATTFTIAAAFVADDATGVWTAGGGVIAGCTTTGAGVTLPAMATVASRFTGVAPLSVFFDATATTGSVAQPFHELAYTWNFGDPSSGTWAYGSRAGSSSRNAATGAVAAHVYETPGTYTVSLTVTDGTSTVTNNCIQIAVQDPNVVFAGANTRCYTQGAVSAGACPGGGTEVLNASADPRTIVQADLAAGRRLLFARGETWTTSNQVSLNVDGPWTIGAYGTGAKPVFRRGAGSVVLGVGLAGMILKDARVMDLQLEDNATNNVVAVNSGQCFDQLTFLRIDVRNTAFGWSGFNWNSSPVKMWDQLSIVDSTVATLEAGGGNSMFIAGTRMAVLGNLLDNAGGGEHNFRSMYFDKLVLSNNTFARPAAAKANITLRAPDFGSANGPLPAGTLSTHAVVSDNQGIGAAGVNQPVNTSIDGAHDARTRHIVFERNWLHSYPGTVGSSFNAIRFNSDFSTIRNNVIDLSGIATTGDVCIDIRNNGGTSPDPTNNWIYNNTCYSTTAYTGVTFPIKGINLAATAINTTVKNNLIYAPNAAAPTTAVSVVSNAGTGTIGASGTFGNSSDAQAITGPVTFTSLALPLTPAGAKPTAGYVIGGGVAVPGEIADFFLSTQPATPDIGAVLH